MSDLHFIESTHQYFDKSTGKELLAVSRVFEFNGMNDFSRVPSEVMEPARLKGWFVHDLARDVGLEFRHKAKIIDEKKLEEEYPEYFPYLASIRRFFEENVKRVVSLEQPVMDKALGYAGTLDIVYIDHDDEFRLDDWKTPVRIPVSTKWQTAAYKRPWEKAAGFKIKERGAVRIKDDGTYERIAYDRHREDEDGFITLLKTAYLKIKNQIK